MSKWLKRFEVEHALVLISMLLVLCLPGCDSNSGSGSGGLPEAKPGPDADSIYIDGLVQGLKGFVIVNNGKDQLTLANNGHFRFLTPMSIGESYDVKISSLPNGQVCELSNSQGHIRLGMSPIVVDCADMLEVNFSVTIPDGYALSDLRLRSNFQEQSFDASTVIKDGIAKNSVFAFNNTFVSLVNNNDEVLYTAYILNPEWDYVMDASSTAISMLVLEPSLALAIRDRAGQDASTGAIQTSTAFLTKFLESLQGLDSVEDLSSSIASLVDNGGSLSDVGEEILSRFAVLHSTILRGLASTVALGSFYDQSSPVDIDAIPVGKKILAKSGDGANVSFNFGPVVVEQPVSVTVKNHDNRFVSVQPQGESAQRLLPPGGSFDFDLVDGLGSQQSFHAEVFGPGLKGELVETSVNSIAEVTAASAVEQYFLPSLSLLLGLKKPLDFDVTACLNESRIVDLRNVVKNNYSDTSLLETSQYHRVYSKMLELAGSEFIRSHDSTSAIKDLLDCEKFGIGVLVEKNKSIAVEHISSIIRLLGPLYAKASAFHEGSDLFQIASLNYLAKAIQQNYGYRLWEISNVLGLSLTAKNDSALYYEDSLIEFVGTCFNPIDQAAIECEITWSFEAGTTKVGAAVENIYASPGSYTIMAEAVDDSGARVESTLEIEVLKKAPAITVTDSYDRALIKNGLAFDFGLVKVGEVGKVDFHIVNDGSDELVISNISSSNPLFSVDSNYKSTLQPSRADVGGGSTELSLSFSPLEGGVQTGNIDIVSNDPDDTVFEFGLKAEGIIVSEQLPGGAVAGLWVVFDSQSADSTTFTAKRVSTTYEATEKRMTLRAFSSADSDFPQMDLKLLGYDLGGGTRGMGTYLLNDTANDLCLGFFALSASDESKQFCTSRLDTKKNLSGRVTITSSEAEGNTKRALFHFIAGSREFCSSGNSSCESIEVTGELFFND